MSWSLGWLSCVFCVAFTLRCAFAFARKQPDIFLALMVFAGQWGVLIVYYSGEMNHPNELLPAISGYLAAVTGFLVYRRHLKRTESQSRHVFTSEELVAFLLLLLAVPKAQHFIPGVTEADLEVVVTLVLDSIGAYSLYRAIAVSQPQRAHRVALSVPIVAYWLANVVFALDYVYEKAVLGHELSVLSPAYIVMFAVLKISLVVTFVPGILAAYEPFRDLTWGARFTHLIHASE